MLQGSVSDMPSWVLAFRGLIEFENKRYLFSVLIQSLAYKASPDPEMRRKGLFVMSHGENEALWGCFEALVEQIDALFTKRGCRQRPSFADSLQKHTATGCWAASPSIKISTG